MTLREKIASKKGQLALLIDPEKATNHEALLETLKKASFAKMDYIFVGGSTVSRGDIERVVHFIKQHSELPVLLFPGASHQLSNEADGLLFLNLISGRNPDFLIGHQVSSAEEVLAMDLEVLSTSYLLIDGGRLSSVAYVSQTTPIPQHQVRIATQTATAGYLIGHQLVYLDAGSGALTPVASSIISAINTTIPSPIIVGGGIKSIAAIETAKSAGANIIVIGNKIEEDVNFLLDIAHFQSTHKEI